MSDPLDQAGDSDTVDDDSPFQDIRGLQEENGSFVNMLNDEPSSTGGLAHSGGRHFRTSTNHSVINNTALSSSTCLPGNEFDFLGSTSSFTEAMPDFWPTGSFGKNGGCEDAMLLEPSPNLELQTFQPANSSRNRQLTQAGTESPTSRNRRLTITVDDADGSDVTAIISAVLQTNAKVTVQRR